MPQRTGVSMYAFVHVEKTAGTTVNTILRRSFGVRHCDIRLPLSKRLDDRMDHRACVEAADLKRVRRLYRDLRGIAGHNVKPYVDLHRECAEIQFFTMLRNPASRFLSYFFHRADSHTKDAFDRWIANDRLHNWQTRMIAGEASARKAIALIERRIGFVGLTERFDESLLMLGNWLGDPAFVPDYRPVNRTCAKRRPKDVARMKSDMGWLDSAEVRARIQGVNAEDQEVYDFVTENVFPNQIEAYRGNLANDLAQFQMHNQSFGSFREPLFGNLMRNFIYKPLIHCYVM
jgi:hypothetical protein